MTFLDAVYLLGATVLAVPYLLVRLVRRKPLVSPLRRLGFVRPTAADDQDVVWVHGVSVGEILAARSLVDALAPRRVLVTSTTATGLQVARETYGHLEVRECPYDLSFAVRRFIRRARPQALILIELELWPNTLAACRASSIPVILANGKISERSLRGYRRVLRWLPRFLDSVRMFLMQDDTYGARLVELGVPPERVQVTGNLKFDNVRFEPGRDRRASLRAEHGFAPEAPIAIFGSTHPGEEALILQACEEVAKGVPGLRLVMVPRHPERVPEVSRMVRRAGWSVGLRSRPEEVRDPTCLIVDTMGELSTLYGLADVAFVGGTLVGVGGHNLLEPAGQGLPLVVGPHLDTVRESADALHAADALTVITSSDSLAAVVKRLLPEPGGRARSAEGARRVVERHTGSTERTMTALNGLLGSV